MHFIQFTKATVTSAVAGVLAGCAIQVSGASLDDRAGKVFDAIRKENNREQRRALAHTVREMASIFGLESITNSLSKEIIFVVQEANDGNADFQYVVQELQKDDNFVHCFSKCLFHPADKAGGNGSTVTHFAGGFLWKYAQSSQNTNAVRAVAFEVCRIFKQYLAGEPPGEGRWSNDGIFETARILEAVANRRHLDFLPEGTTSLLGDFVRSGKQSNFRFCAPLARLGESGFLELIKSIETGAHSGRQSSMQYVEENYNTLGMEERDRLRPKLFNALFKVMQDNSCPDWLQNMAAEKLYLIGKFATPAIPLLEAWSATADNKNWRKRDSGLLLNWLRSNPQKRPNGSPLF